MVLTRPAFKKCQAKGLVICSLVFWDLCMSVCPRTLLILALLKLSNSAIN